MNSRFVYVFDEKARDLLLEQNFLLLKSDSINNIFIFENDTSKNDVLRGIIYMTSNTLTF